jgi:quinol monooxygenase YgiN
MSEKMSKDSGFQRSRRQMLGQGLSASLGLMLWPQQSDPQRSEHGGKLLAARSLLSLTSNPSKTPVPETLNQVPITVTIHFTAKANQTETLINQLSQALPDARQAPGCRDARLYITASNPNQIILIKTWDSSNAQNEYLRWEQSSGRLAKLLALVEGDPRVEYWELQAT